MAVQQMSNTIRENKFEQTDHCALEKKPLLTIEEAQTSITSSIHPICEMDTIPLNSALGRVLAQPIYAPINLPYERNAAMDGYAFSSASIIDKQAFTLNLVGSSWAGKPFQDVLPPNACIRIFTGAVVPDALDSVVMQEHVSVEGTRVHFSASTQGLQNIRSAGEDVKQNDLLCHAPKIITMDTLALLASAGVDTVAVTRRLKIIFFSTGDELMALGESLQSGKIFDSNRYLLNSLLTSPSYDLVDGGVIADDQSKLEDTLRQAAKNYDVIITTGGASVGEADFVKETLARCGHVNFWKIAVKPGKPLAFGKIGHSYFFGLPGNPVAVRVTFQHLVAPALKQLQGLAHIKPLRFLATATCALKKSPGRLEFQTGVLTQTDQGEFVVNSAGKQGSHILSSLDKANCFIILPLECSGVQTGDAVLIEPFSTAI